MSCNGLMFVHAGSSRVQTVKAHFGISGLHFGGPHDLPGWSMVHSIRDRPSSSGEVGTCRNRGVLGCTGAFDGGPKNPLPRASLHD
jgi:hypothetical protein